jgi:hypothetical protein
MIYGIPGVATEVLIIDPLTGTATRSAMGADLSGSYKFAEGVLGTDGKIYGSPLHSANILIISFGIESQKMADVLSVL